MQELNERFGDWYYVIDNRVYQQIHLSRDDVIEATVIKSTQEAEAEGDADDAPGIGLPGLPNLPLGQ